MGGGGSGTVANNLLMGKKAEFSIVKSEFLLFKMTMYVAINIIYAQIPHLLKFENDTFSPS